MQVLCRYSYSEVEDIEDEGIPLTSSGVKVSGELMERKPATITDHVFEVIEEDKRE